MVSFKRIGRILFSNERVCPVTQRCPYINYLLKSYCAREIPFQCVSLVVSSKLINKHKDSPYKKLQKNMMHYKKEKLRSIFCNINISTILYIHACTYIDKELWFLFLTNTFVLQHGTLFAIPIILTLFTIREYTLCAQRLLIGHSSIWSRSTKQTDLLYPKCNNALTHSCFKTVSLFP